MKKKGLIALMVAGAIATMPLGLVGCADKIGDVEGAEELTASNLVVACLQRHKIVLHKANVYTTSGDGYYRAWYIRDRYDFACDLQDMSKVVYTFPDGVPDESFGLYDEVCEDCFSKGWN